MCAIPTVPRVPGHSRPAGLEGNVAETPYAVRVPGAERPGPRHERLSGVSLERVDARRAARLISRMSCARTTAALVALHRRNRAQAVDVVERLGLADQARIYESLRRELGDELVLGEDCHDRIVAALPLADALGITSAPEPLTAGRRTRLLAARIILHPLEVAVPLVLKAVLAVILAMLPVAIALIYGAGIAAAAGVLVGQCLGMVFVYGVVIAKAETTRLPRWRILGDVGGRTITELHWGRKHALNAGWAFANWAPAVTLILATRLLPTAWADPLRRHLLPIGLVAAGVAAVAATALLAASLRTVRDLRSRVDPRSILDHVDAGRIELAAGCLDLLARRTRSTRPLADVSLALALVGRYADIDRLMAAMTAEPHSKRFLAGSTGSRAPLRRSEARSLRGHLRSRMARLRRDPRRAIATLAVDMVNYVGLALWLPVAYAGFGTPWHGVMSMFGSELLGTGVTFCLVLDVVGRVRLPHWRALRRHAGQPVNTTVLGQMTLIEGSDFLLRLATYAFVGGAVPRS